MPKYKITDPDSGELVTLRGDSPPTEVEIEEAFHQLRNDPSRGTGTLQFGPFDTGVEVPQGVNRFLAGAGKAFSDLGTGVEQAVRHAVPGVSPEEAALDREVTERKRRDRPLMNTGAGLAGNIAGNVAATLPLAAVPGAGTYRGAALLGSGLGALQPVAEDESRGFNTALGGVGGVGGRAVSGLVSRVMSPRTGANVREILDEDVALTPGQILGGATKRVEEGAKSIPLLGDIVKRGERRSFEEWNRATINKALAPLQRSSGNSRALIPAGTNAPATPANRVASIGREGMEEAHDIVSDHYERALRRVGTVKADDAYTSEMNKLRLLARNLPPAERNQFDNLMYTQVESRISPNGAMPAHVMKTIDSELGRYARGYSADQSFDRKLLGDALQEAQAVLRRLVERTNPDAAASLREVNAAFANLLRVQRASQSLGAHQGDLHGVFTGAQLKNAAKATDTTLRKRAFTHGQAPMQRWAEAGQSVMGDTVPDSGTPFRIANQLGLAGLIAGGAADPVVPLLAAGAGAATGAAYSRPGMRALAALLAQRPEVMRQAGNAVSRAGPLAALLGATGATQMRD